MTSVVDSDWTAAARKVLADYGLEPKTIARVPQGLINLTLDVVCTDGRRFVLQRLHRVFGPEVNDNIASVAAHLRSHGLTTPDVVPACNGRRSVTRDDGLWRLLSFVPGRAFDALTTSPQAASAGALLGRFHAALVDFRGELRSERPPVHDLHRHLDKLTQVLDAYRSHPLRPAVDTAARAVRTMLDGITAFAVEPPRIVHGDPKISNVMFDEAGETARCLIDLDTLTRMPLAFELGDAMRSWCNPHGEDAAGACFERPLFEAAVTAYLEAARGFISAAECHAIVPATETIHCELAARFLADALEESYFAWDDGRFATRGEHNLARARGQLAACESLRRQGDSARRTIRAAVVQLGID